MRVKTVKKDNNNRKIMQSPIVVPTNIQHGQRPNNAWAHRTDTYAGVYVMPDIRRIQCELPHNNQFAILFIVCAFDVVCLLRICVYIGQPMCTADEFANGHFRKKNEIMDLLSTSITIMYLFVTDAHSSEQCARCACNGHSICLQKYKRLFANIVIVNRATISMSPT